jgi:hypothetical protein
MRQVTDRRTKTEYAIAALIYVSAIFVSVYSYKAGGLYNDNLTFFSLFRDNAFSLNRFGEPAWWLPHVYFGHPGYVSSALGPSVGLSPVNVAFDTVLWAMHGAGIYIRDFAALYVIDAFAVIPSVFMLCAWLISSEFRNAHTRLALFAMSAFSPLVIQNLADPGMVETAAYTLLCAYASLRYIRRPAIQSFFLLTFALSLLLHTLNFAFLFWGFPFLLMLVWVLFGTASFRSVAFRTLRQESAIRIALGLAALIVAALPFVNVWRRLPEFAKPSMNSVSYDIAGLVAGNPLQLLLMSTPGFNFSWDFYRPSPAHPTINYFPHIFQAATSFGYGYLGILAIPLIIVGLRFGRRAMAWRLGVLMLLMWTIVVLSGFSPFFSLTALVFGPIRSNNHYSDLFFQSGGFLIPLFLALLGLDRIFNGHRRAARLGFITLIVTTIISLTLILYLNRNTAAQFGTSTGLLLLLSTASAFCLYELTVARTRTALRRYSAILVYVLVIDLATFAFLQVRTAITHSTATRDVHNTTTDSLEVLSDAATYSARGMLVRKEQVPLLESFAPSNAVAHIVPENTGTATLVNRTFNRISFRTNSTAPATLIVNDAWDPYWSATVDGKPAAVQRAGVFKSIAIAAGDSSVQLVYSPSSLKWTLAFSYGILILLGLLSFNWKRPLPRNIV